MNSGMIDNDLFKGLFVDPLVAAEFSAASTLRHFIEFEAALTRSLAKVGVIDAATGQAAVARVESFSPDSAAIAAATVTDGLPVPEFVRQLKAHVGADLAGAIHVGATSQDLIDTAMVLALRTINKALAARIASVVAALGRVSAAQGGNRVMGRTRMQAALPVTVADRIAIWTPPLEQHLLRLDALRPQLERVQFGGPVGVRSMPGQTGDAIAGDLARQFGLGGAAKAWHTMRDSLADYANWLSLVTGALGKMGMDLSLMAQQGIDEVVLAGGGRSSAMAHKQNPVLAETLVSFARYNAVQLSGMHMALVHEQERSGAAWALEWMILPAMAGTTAKALDLAGRLIGQIEQIGQPPA